mgnify:FL=1
MIKTSGILDQPKDTLAKDVWSDAQTLLPRVRAQILKYLYSWIPSSQVKEVVVLGSITGYKYKLTSDIDVNVKVSGKENAAKYHKHQDVLNGQTVTGTEHPINFFIQEYNEEYHSVWQDAHFGVYDVLNNEWLSPPPDRSEVRIPEDQYPLELLIGQMMARNYSRKADDYLDNTDETGDDLEQLQSASETTKLDRKLQYSTGWGIPRKSFRNILYKLLEHGKYGDLFYDMKRGKSEK